MMCVKQKLDNRSHKTMLVSGSINDLSLQSGNTEEAKMVMKHLKMNVDNV